MTHQDVKTPRAPAAPSTKRRVVRQRSASRRPGTAPSIKPPPPMNTIPSVGNKYHKRKIRTSSPDSSVAACVGAPNLKDLKLPKRGVLVGGMNVALIQSHAAAREEPSPAPSACRTDITVESVIDGDADDAVVNSLHPSALLRLRQQIRKEGKWAHQAQENAVKFEKENAEQREARRQKQRSLQDQMQAEVRERKAAEERRKTQQLAEEKERLQREQDEMAALVRSKREKKQEVQKTNQRIVREQQRQLELRLKEEEAQRERDKRQVDQLVVKDMTAMLEDQRKLREKKVAQRKLEEKLHKEALEYKKKVKFAEEKADQELMAAYHDVMEEQHQKHLSHLKAHHERVERNLTRALPAVDPNAIGPRADAERMASATPRVPFPPQPHGSFATRTPREYRRDLESQIAEREAQKLKNRECDRQDGAKSVEADLEEAKEYWATQRERHSAMRRQLSDDLDHQIASAVRLQLKREQQNA